MVLTSQPAHDVTVTITHSGDGDISIDDQEFTFTDSDWETAKTVTVSAAQDDDAGDDTAALSHAVASADADYNGITVSEVAIAVTDDETAGVSITPTELTIAEGGSDSYQVVLTSQPAHDVTITIAHSGDGDIGIDDQELTFTDSDWQTAQTVTVTAAHDDDAMGTTRPHFSHTGFQHRCGLQRDCGFGSGRYGHRRRDRRRVDPAGELTIAEEAATATRWS